MPYLGQQRADLEYPMESFFDAGVHVASASDYPVTIPPDPLSGIAVGVNRWMPGLVHEYPAPPDLDGILWPQERATVKQMIRSFTIGGARANFLDKATGTIKVGKRADLVVLDTNILKVEDSDRPVRRPRALHHGQRQVLYDTL